MNAFEESLSESVLHFPVVSLCDRFAESFHLAFECSLSEQL